MISVGKISLETGKIDDERFGEHLDFIVLLHTGHQMGEMFLNVGPFDGFGQFPGQAPQLGVLFHQHHLEALVRNSQRRGHAGDAAAHHQCPFVDGDGPGPERFQKGYPRHGHADQILGLLRGSLRVIPVYPGVVVSDNWPSRRGIC